MVYLVIVFLWHRKPHPHSSGVGYPLTPQPSNDASVGDGGGQGRDMRGTRGEGRHGDRTLI